MSLAIFIQLYRFSPFSVARFIVAGSLTYSGENDSAWAALVVGGGRLRTRYSRSVAMLLLADFFVVAPRPEARSVQQPMAKTAHPGLLGTIAAEMEW